MNDQIGDRMKQQYEDRTRQSLPRRTYTLLRLDGKAFHTYTQGCQQPFDEELIKALDQTAIYLCSEMQGAVMSYLQSDEISILLQDFTNIHTNAWFDGNIQKMVSVSASLATAKFNELRVSFGKVATFDARVFTIPDPFEVENYFIWRQQDWTRNSVTAVAQTVYSHKELHNKNISERLEMLFQKGVNWNSFPAHQKRGRCVIKKMGTKVVPNVGVISAPLWVTDNEIPVFTQDRSYLRNQIPLISGLNWENSSIIKV